MTGPLTRVVVVLQTALDALTCQDADCCSITPDVCRTAVYLGGEVPWDTCDSGCSGKRNGMLWAKIVSIDPTAGGTDTGSCASYTWTAEIGVVRCITGLNQDGSPPSAAAVAKDARQQVADADAIYAALRCCPTRPDALQDVSLTRWAPVGPQGNCAGGAWSVRGSLDVCC